MLLERPLFLHATRQHNNNAATAPWNASRMGLFVIFPQLLKHSRSAGYAVWALVGSADGARPPPVRDYPSSFFFLVCQRKKDPPLFLPPFFQKDPSPPP